VRSAKPFKSKRSTNWAMPNSISAARLDGTRFGSSPFASNAFDARKNKSLRFRKTLAIRRKLDRPRWSLRYVAKYRGKDNPDRLVERLQRFSLGHGWYVLKDRTEIHGTFYGQDKSLTSKRRLEQLRKELSENDQFLSLRLGRVRLSS